MADPILEKAIAKREAAQREVNKWTNFIDGYRELMQNAAEAVPATAPLGLGQPGRRVIKKQWRRPADRPLPPDSELGKTVAAVEAALNERGHPMPLAALYDAVVAKGLVITGAKPRDNLGARLYNSGRFRSIDKHTGWWFADRPAPGAPPDASPPTATGSSTSGSGTEEPSNGGGTLFSPPAKLNGSVSAVALMSGGMGAMGH